MATSPGSAPLCPSCATTVVQIRLGTGSVLNSCSRCDKRWWLTDGAPSGLVDVLAGVAESDSRRLRLAS